MRIHVAAVLTLMEVVSACGWAQVRPGAKVNMEVPFHRGVNLTGWFQADSPRQIQFTKFTKQDFLDIKSLGCDVIRLPINLHFMTSGAPDTRSIRCSSTSWTRSSTGARSWSCT